MGTLRGGRYCGLADAAMGFAYAGTLGEGETFTTIDTCMKLNRRPTIPQERQIDHERI
jgi:acyl-coenzyme A thioesterase PaaI-like protein